MAQEVNVEQIMSQIREEIKEKGLTKDMLSFDDVIVDTSNMNSDHFEKDIFAEQLDKVNQSWELTSYKILHGNKVAVVFKKVIRKMLYFLIDPILADQSDFNASNVRLMNQLSSYIEERDAKIKELEQRIAELEKKG